MHRPTLLALLLAGCGLVGRTDGGPTGGGAGTVATGGGSAETGGGSGGGTAGGTGGGTVAPSWHYDRLDAGFSANFVSVHGRSATDFWVVASEGGLYHFDGSAFVQVHTAADLRSVVATANEVYAVTASALLSCQAACDQPGALFDSTAPVPVTVDLTGTCVHPTQGAFAVGNDPSGNSGMWGFDGFWKRFWYGSNVRGLRACFVTTDGRVMAPGIEAVLSAAADGGGRDTLNLPGASEQWWSAAGTDAGMVVGGTGWRLLTRENGSAWATVLGTPGGSGTVRSISALSSTDVVAGGTYTGGRGLMIRQSAVWRAQNHPIDVFGVWAVDATHFIAVGNVPDAGVSAVVSASFR